MQFLDHDGHGPTLHTIVCTVTKRGDWLRVDFTGTDPQADGSINCTWGGVRAATLAAMFIMLAWDLPWNEGVARCLELVAPPGTVCTWVYSKGTIRQQRGEEVFSVFVSAKLSI